jgi:hypothetical protein
MNHLKETARHYANLAEQYRSELNEQQQLNQDLLVVIDALCEELNLDTEQVLQQLDEKFWKKAGLGLAAAGLIGAAAIGLKGNSNPTATSGDSGIKVKTTQYGDQTTGGEKREISGDGWSSTREGSWSRTGPGVKSPTTSGKSSTNKGTYTPAKPRSGKGVPSGSGGGGIDEP